MTRLRNAAGPSCLAGILVFIAVAAAACGGSLGGGGSSSGSPNEPGQSSSSAACASVAVIGSRVCVPATASPNKPISLQIDDPEGCLSCSTTVDKCTVSVEGSMIRLAMTALECKSSGSPSCPAVCAIPSATCTIPPLAAGEYEVITNAADERNLPSLSLVVAEGATETSCALVQPGAPPPQHDGSKYSRSCSKDTDCRPATFGNVCVPCSCSNAAIAVTSSDQYEADRRAIRSQCPAVESLGCGPCSEKAVCVIEGNAATGTCALETGP